MRTVAISWDASAGRFVARGSHAAHQIHVNAPRRADETRRSTGFSATELLLAGAGACSSWDVVEMLRKRRDDVTSVEVTVEGEQASDPPWPYETEIVPTYYDRDEDGLPRRWIQLMKESIAAAHLWAGLRSKRCASALRVDRCF